MPFIGFAELKDRVPIEDAIPKLDLVLKERNGQLQRLAALMGENGCDAVELY